MKKIEKIKIKNTFKRYLLALILIAGFALFSNANLSYAADEKEMNFGGDIAAGEAMYKQNEDGSYTAVLPDNTVIHRYPNGNLKTMELPTTPPSKLKCEEGQSIRKDINWLGGLWDVATAGTVALYNHAETVIGSAFEVGKGILTEQNYDQTMENMQNIMRKNANDVKKHGQDLMGNFISSNCKFDDGTQEYEYNLTAHGTIDEDHALQGCKPMPLKVSELSTCFLCPLLNIILATCDQMGAIAMNMFSKPIRLLLAVGLALYLAMSVLTHISSFVKVDAAKFWQGVFVQSFKVLFAYMLLVHPSSIYDYLVSPILSSALEYGEAIAPLKLSTSINAEKYLTRDALVLSPHIYRKLMDFLIAIQTNLSTTQAIGSTLICTSNTDAMRDLHTLMNFQMFFQGVVIYVFALLLSIAFAFYTIDVIANLGVLFGLMPLLIVAWPFKITSGYPKKGFNILLTAAFTFIFMATMAVLVIKLIEASFGTDSTQMIKLFNEGDAKEIDQLFDMSGYEFLSLIACALFGFKFMGNVTQHAKDFGGHSAKSIAPKLGGRAASAVTSAANKVASPVKKYAGKKLGEGFQKAKDTIAQGLGTSSNTQSGNEIGANQGKAPEKVATRQQPKNLGGGATPPTGGGNAPSGGGKPASGNTSTNNESENTGNQGVSINDLEKEDKTKLKNALDNAEKGGIKPKITKNTKFIKSKNGTISFTVDGKTFQVNNSGGLTEIKK